MGLAQLVSKKVDPRTRLSPEQLRKARPLRNPDVKWEVAEDGRLLLVAPLTQQGRGFTGWLARRMKLPNEKKFELEPIGAFLWEIFDGKHTVEGISRKLRDKYKINRLEADASLNAFLQMLTQRKLITLLVGTKGSKD
jgi:hypothetical protein